jgi:tetratricopeptide (TPR) repeat protein
MGGRKKMTLLSRFILLVIGIVIAAAIFLAPRGNEQLAIMGDEKQQARLIHLLEQQTAKDEIKPALLATLGRAYAEIGDNQRAAQVLEHYTELRPDDGAAFARTADLYKSIGDQEKQIAMLRRNIAVTPTLSRIAELAELYRMRQRPDQELALLTQYEPLLTVESGELLRLAELYAGNRNQDSAIRLLLRGEEAAPSQPSHNERERLLLAKLLVEAGRSHEAVRLGEKWIRQWHEPWLAGQLLSGVALHGPVADASELADAVAATHPEVRFYLAHDLAMKGAQPVARHMLENWVTANPSPSMIEIATFLTACRDLGEQTVIWQAFSDVLTHPSSDDLVIRWIDAVAGEFGIGAIAPFWGSLPNGLLGRRPMLAARLAFYEHDLITTKWLLGKVDLAAIEQSDRQAWIDLLNVVAAPTEVFEVLHQLRRGGRLPSDLLPSYARLAGSLGQDVEYRDALADLGVQSPGAMVQNHP